MHLTIQYELSIQLKCFCWFKIYFDWKYMRLFPVWYLKPARIDISLHSCWLVTWSWVLVYHLEYPELYEKCTAKHTINVIITRMHWSDALVNLRIRRSHMPAGSASQSTSMLRILIDTAFKMLLQILMTNISVNKDWSHMIYGRVSQSAAQLCLCDLRMLAFSMWFFMFTWIGVRQR